MKQREPIRVFEHESLYIKKYQRRGRGLTQEQLDRLYGYNDKHGNRLFVPIRGGVKFTSYVGVIQIGNLTIEILPKADNNSNGGYGIWQKVLLGMLEECRYIKRHSEGSAMLRRRENSLLDLYFQMFVDEFRVLAQRGLMKQYRQEEGNKTALKGQLMFPKHIRENFIHKERFYSRHQTYNHDNLHNQILYRAFNILDNLTFEPELKEQIEQLRLMLPPISNKNITEEDFNFLRWHRKSEPYRRAISIAKLLILNYSPDIRTGREDMLAILFDMNQLWEEYIYRVLRRSSGENYRVTRQNSKVFWHDKSVRPDIVVKCTSSGQYFVLDTKWKIIDSDSPSDADLKQMYVYNMYWNAPKSLLIYPRTDGQDDFKGRFHKGRDEAVPNNCKIAFVDVLDDKNGLASNIGNMILSKFDGVNSEADIEKKFLKQ